MPVTDRGCWRGQESDVALMGVIFNGDRLHSAGTGLDLGCPGPACWVGQANEEEELRAEYARVASFLAQRLLPRVGQWGKGPWHTLSWALSSLPVPCTVPHPVLCSLSWLLPPVLPRIERAAVKQRPPIQFRKPPCVWLCPSLSRVHGQGPRLSRPRPPWLCPGALWQVSLQV